MIVAAAIFGVAVAGVARGRGSRRLPTAVSGFGGPALVAAAYLLAGPSAGDSRGPADPYYAALLATAAGLVASAVVALPGRYRAAPDRARARRTRRVTRPRPRPASPAPAQGDVLVSTRSPVPAGAPSGAPGRPAWAEGSGPYARAYTSGGYTGGAFGGAALDDDPYRSVLGSEREAESEAVAVPARGTGWDADTIPGTTHAPAGRHTDADETGGLYRSGGTYVTAPEPPADPHESWLHGFGTTGRHAAVE
jgi:hypothetical protein